MNQVRCKNITMKIGSWGYGERREPTQIDTKDDLDIGNNYKALALALPSKETLESALETSFRPIFA
jgi:hypothetical protein